MFARLVPLIRSLGVLAAILAVNTFLLGKAADNAYLIYMYLAVNVVLFGLARGQRREASRRDGWSHLTVSVSQWLIAAGALGLTLFLLYIFHYVGSARHDAEFQMRVLQWLIAGFGLITAVMTWATFASFTRWNDEAVEQDTLFVGRRAIRFADIVAVRYVTWSDSLRIEGSDGAVIYIPSMHNGAHEFDEMLAKRLEAKHST